MDSTIELIKEIEPEMRWHNDELLVFFYGFQVEDVMQALSDDCASIFDDGGLEVYMKDGYIVMDMAEVFEYCGEDPQILLNKKEEDD